MQLSPVQLVHLTFRKVLVEVDRAVVFDAENLSTLSAFNFDGVPLRTRIHIEKLPDIAPPAGGPVFEVSFDLLVSNAPSDDGSESARSPYLIDIQAAALVRLSPELAEDNLDEWAAVNGASLIWSAIREQVSTLSARMARGPALLPSVHFLDLRNSQDHRRGRKPAPAKASKKRK